MNTIKYYHYLIQAILDSKKALLVAFGVLILSIAAFLYLEQPKYKTSWVMLLPGTDRATTLNLENMGEARSNGNNVYGNIAVSPKNTYKEIALSYPVIAEAAKQFDVSAQSFSKPRVKLIDQTPAIKFTLKGTDPIKLKSRAAIYNKAFEEVLGQLRSNEIERHYHGIESNLTEAKERLNNARKAIIDYQMQGGVVSDKQFDLWTQQAETLRAQKVNAKVALSEAQAAREELRLQLGVSDEQANAIMLMQSNPKVISVLYSLTQIAAQQVSEHAKLAPQHPKRRLIDREVNALGVEIMNLLTPYPSLASLPKQRLYALLAQDASELIKQLSAARVKIRGLQEQVTTLIEQLTHYENRIVVHTKDTATLSDLKRDHQIAEAIFSSALAKLDTGKLDIYATYPLTQLLTQPGQIVNRDRLGTKLMLVALVLVYGLASAILVLLRIRVHFLQRRGRL